MKRNILFWTLALLLPLTGVAAPASLSIENTFDIQAGEEQELVIDLTNPDDAITLVQFDLRLPEGLSLKTENGEYVFDMANRTTWRKHSLDVNATDGIFRFLLASNSNTLISGTEGAIITMTLVADGSFTGCNIQLENILLVGPDEQETKQDTYVYAVGTVEPPLPPAGSATLSIEPFQITPGGEQELVIDLTNPDDEITLVQFDLRLPEGLALKQEGGEYVFDIAGRTTWKKHSLDMNATDGILRFLMASNSNAVLTGSEGAIIKMTLVADRSFTGGDIRLENILMVSPNEAESKQEDYVYPVEVDVLPDRAWISVEEPFFIYAGAERELTIDLTNPEDEITLVQFDLRLPDGLSLKTMDGDYVYDIAGRTSWKKHSLDINATNGIVRFLLASNSNIVLSGTEGGIIKTVLVADEAYQEGSTIRMENILLVSPDETEIKPRDVAFAIVRQKGDVNGDCAVNALDIQAIINAAVADSKEPLYDINGDGIVNALDIQAVIIIAATGTQK